jgi:hypothetical protein
MTSSNSRGYDSTMDKTPIIQFIDAQIARLEQAKAVLNGHTTRQSVEGQSAPELLPKMPSQFAGRMGAEGRARIVAAQKARWAKVKKG